MENLTTPKAVPHAVYYSAAWTACGCLITCGHQHRNIAEAVACIQCAASYVVAVEAEVMRCLTAAEEVEFEFECAVYPLCAKTTKPVKAEPQSECQITHRTEGETLVEFVLRFRSLHQEAEHPSEEAFASEKQKRRA